MMNTQDDVSDVVLGPDDTEAFHREGYMVVRGVLSRGEAAAFAELVRGLLPADLDIPDHWESFDGRIKPFSGPGIQTFDGPDFVPLFQNERLYRIAAHHLAHERLLVRDGSLAITLRNDTPHASPLSQPLHLDPAVPEDVDEFLFTEQEVEVGGCFYLTDVRSGGGGVHVVPGGHRLVEAEASGAACGRQLHDKWRSISGWKTVEVTADAGDFVMMHHLMPHAASHNRQSATRIAQFLRWSRDDQPYVMGHRPGDGAPDRTYDDRQIQAMTPLGRKLFGVDPWDGGGMSDGAALGGERSS